MTRFRAAFLPLFLMVLALVVAAAVWARMRAYDAAVAPNASSDTATTVATRDVLPQRSPAHVAPGEPNLTTSSAASPDAGTIVEADGSSQPAGASLSRAERFRQLLTAPLTPPSNVGAPAGANAQPAPPQPAPAAPQKQPSTLAKLVAPIVNAISGGPAPLKPASRATAASTNANNDSHERTPGGARDDKRPDPNDKTSDSMPPQLFRVEFVPQQVQDGQEAIVAFTVNDDLSGVRNVSGSITSPTGKALQGFAAQREAESNRYVGRVQIPRDAEEGPWHVNFLSLSDNASNTVNLTYAQNGLLQAATLRVTSSRPDSTPPTVRNVWLDRRAMNGGEKNTLFVQAVDDKSGVNLVTGVFLSPAGFARIGFGCKAGENDVWSCELMMPKLLDCGEWHLEQLQTQDKANNMGSDRSATVTGVKLAAMSTPCDSQPPVVTSFSLQPNEVSNVHDSVVRVTATVMDEGGSGVSNVSGQVGGPSGASRLFFSMRPTGDGQTWTGDFVVPALAAKGTWRVVWLQAQDEARNAKSYSSEPMLASAAFVVK